MTKKAINPQTMYLAQGEYSHGLEVSESTRLLFVSGQIPKTPEGAIPEGFEEQCHQVWRNIDAILIAAQMTMANVVKTTIFLTRHEDSAQNSEIRRSYLGDAQHSLTVVVVKTLHPEWLLEIEVIAAA